MLKWFKRRRQAENTSYFLLFLSVFTGIFFVMTLIILQILRTGVYTSVDTSLVHAANAVDDYVDMAMKRSYFLESDGTGTIVKVEPNKEKPRNKLVSVDVLFYDKNGYMFNTADAYSDFSRVSLRTEDIGKVVEAETETHYGQTERYHALTVRVDNGDHPNIRYATFIVGIRQLEETNQRSCNVIISVMIFFWIVSMGASMYLAKWTRQPILENYAKQKAFVENASHELRTPLTVLQNRLESLFRKPDTTVLENTETIASSLEEVRNMRILTTNLLNLARRDDGLKPKVSEIAPGFFMDSFANYQMIAEEAGKVFIARNLVNRSVISDKALLKQLMTILFDNAIKYTGDEGVITLTVSTTEKQLIITVADNGDGISDDNKKKVFDRFYRVDKARTRQKGGFGLGLSLAKQIVESLDGTITIRDNQPKGTVFEVTL